MSDNVLYEVCIDTHDFGVFERNQAFRTQWFYTDKDMALKMHRNLVAEFQKHFIETLKPMHGFTRIAKDYSFGYPSTPLESLDKGEHYQKDFCIRIREHLFNEDFIPFEIQDEKQKSMKYLVKELVNIRKNEH